MSSEPVRTRPAQHGASAVQEALDKLRALQDVLHKKHEIEAEIDELPRSLATRTELLDQARRAYVERNEEQESTEARIDRLRDDAVEAERVREEYEQQMDQIRTQREYEALDKQIRDASEREMDYRRALQEEERRRDELQEELAGKAELIEQQEGVVRDEDSRIKVELADREQRLAALREEESAIAAGLDEELLYNFDRIVKSTDGYGIVPLQGTGVCTGCYMTLPAHFVNRVRRAEEVLFCTHGRIVFYEDAAGDDETEAQIDVFDDEPGFFADADDEGEDDAELFLDIGIATDDEDGGDDDDGDDGGRDDHEPVDDHESDGD